MKSLSLAVTLLVLLSYAYLGYCAPIAGSLLYAPSSASHATPLNSADWDGHYGACCDCSAVSLDHLVAAGLPRLDPNGPWQSRIVPISDKPLLFQIDPPPRAAFI
jgi:hypothetical protein